MSVLGGGWERVAYFDSSSSTSCPGTTENYTIGSLSLCTNNVTSKIASANYTAVTTSFSQVMGLMTAYTSEAGFGFAPYGTRVTDLQGVYMDGISLVITDDTDFVKHIHSTVVADYTKSSEDKKFSCYLFGQSDAYLPYVVGADHTCSVLTSDMYMPLNGSTTETMQYFGDSWNGNCDDMAFYCRHVNRYFVKNLPQALTSADNMLTVRLMSHSNITIGLNHLEIYVR